MFGLGVGNRKPVAPLLPHIVTFEESVGIVSAGNVRAMVSQRQSNYMN